MIAGGASVGWSGHAATSQLEWYRYGIVFSIKADMWRTLKKRHDFVHPALLTANEQNDGGSDGFL